jgi:hypothetical protein
VLVERCAWGEQRRCREDVKFQGWMERAVEYERQVGWLQLRQRFVIAEMGQGKVGEH